MAQILSTLSKWPTTNTGQPKLFCTEDAYFYANLIYDHEHLIAGIRKYHDQARKDLMELSKDDNADLDAMGNLATKVQYYRECLEEIQRINDDKFLA